MVHVPAYVYIQANISKAKFHSHYNNKIFTSMFTDYNQETFCLYLPSFWYTCTLTACSHRTFIYCKLLSTPETKNIHKVAF